jgi:hypothetical protein
MIPAFHGYSKGLINGPAVKNVFPAAIHRFRELPVLNSALDGDFGHLRDGADLAGENPGLGGGRGKGRLCH